MDFHVPWTGFVEVSGLEVCDGGDEQGGCCFGVGGCGWVGFGSGGVGLVSLKGFFFCESSQWCLSYSVARIKQTGG